MPVDFETRYRRFLKGVVTISQTICDSALERANSQNFGIFERLHRQLETIRISADTIHVALAKASLSTYTLDDRIADWLVTGELHSCLEMLKEMNDILRLNDQVCPAGASTGSLRPASDGLTPAMVFFDRHQPLFHFLLTPDIWNCENINRQPEGASQVSSLATTDDHQDTRSTISTNIEHSGHGPLTERIRSTTSRGKELLQLKLDEVSRWLAPLDCSEKHNNILKLRQEGTCGWFLDTNAFKKWRVSGNRFLWLHGQAGCGKSVLVASIIEFLRETRKDGEVIAFFYSDFQNERSTSPTELIRSVLWQLFRHSRDHGVDYKDLPNEILEAKSKGTLSLGDLDQLCDFVLRTADCFVWYPIVVIDALDEFVDIRALLCALVKLNLGSVRLLVTSRPHQIIAGHLGSLPSLSFKDVAKESAFDIALHVRRVVDTHNCLRAAGSVMKQEVQAQLNKRAEGRFRWVQCQLDILKQCQSEQELKEALKNLPTELEATYERILGAVDERKLEGKLVRRVLLWLVIALEPLRLEQIIDGLFVSLGQQTIEYDKAVLRTTLLCALSSLVLHYEETDLFVLSHYTVKEYLVSDKALPTYHIVPHEAHAEVAQMCMSCISVFLKHGLPPVKVPPLKSFPVLSYILSSGFNHLAYVDPSSTDVVKALESLGSDVRHHPSQWERLCELREEDHQLSYPPWPSSRHDFVPYILVAYSPPGLLRLFLHDQRPLKLRISTNPLVYAADLRKTEHAMVLLQFGVDVNMRGFAIDDSCHAYALPLEVAIDFGEDVLVGELLQRGSVVTSDVLVAAIYLPWCSIPVLVKLMQSGNFMEWAHEVGDEMLYRCIFSTARPSARDNRKADEDLVTLARILCQIGMNLSADDPLRTELIQRAIHAAHISFLEFLLPPDQPPPARFFVAASMGNTPETVPVVRFFIQKGVDVQATLDGGGDTSLHLAARCPWEPRSLELTQILVGAGCNLHIFNVRGETPFIIAVKRGYCSVAEFLLSCGVRLPSNILHLALRQQCRNHQMIQWLICRGANVHVVSPSGNTVLHSVIEGVTDDDGDDGEDEDEEHVDKESECLELMKCFIEAGCNPTTPNPHGKTVLGAAIGRDYALVVEYLLSHNVPFPLDILLLVLQEKSTPQIIRSLIQNGANVGCAMCNGDTVLHLAIAEYTEETCLDLTKGFIDAGCNPATCNFQGKSALETAVENEYPSVVELLLSYDVPLPSDILTTALRRCLPLHMIQFLIHKGAYVHSVTSDGDTVLHLSITGYLESPCLDLVKYFIEAGCNTATCNFEGKTVLEAAVLRSYTSVVELLLSRNIPLPPNILTIALRSCVPLHLIQYLIRGGADVHSITSDGDTVLHLGIAGYAESTCCDFAKTFIEAGGNPAIHNAKGEAAFDVAIQYARTSVVELLLSYHVPLPRDILTNALWKRSPLSSSILQLLIHNGADVHSTTSNGDSLLHLAIARYPEPTGLDLVKHFIQAGCNPAASNTRGETALEVAVQHGFTSVVELLLSHNVPLPLDVLSNALQQRSPLESSMLQLLIRNGANSDLYFATASGETALHLAVAGYPELTCLGLVKNLIEAGCNPAACNSEGRTVLEAAVQRDHTLVVELLLSYNVSFPPDILVTALRQGSSFHMIQFLVRMGADLQSSAENGTPVLHLAIAEYPESTCLVLARTLIGAGYNPAACNSCGKTALEAALEREYTLVAELLLVKDVPLPPKILITALRRRLPLRIIQLLICKDADVHSTTPDEDTVFHLVTGYPESTCLILAKGFIAAGCNPSKCNSSGKSALDAAVEAEYDSVVELLLLLNVPFPPNLLLFVVGRGLPLCLAQLLIQKGADVHATTSSGDTTLHLTAAGSGYSESICWELAETLLQAGCNPTASNFKGKTVLEAAVQYGRTSLVELLLSYGVLFPPDIVTTALRRRSPPNMVRFLIRNGGNLHSIMSNGNTALHLAVAMYPESVCLDLVKDFVEAGCDPAVCNHEDRTVLEAAVQYGFISVLELLASFNVSFPPDILPTALLLRSPLHVVQFLIRKGADVHCTASNGDTLFHLAITKFTGLTCLGLVDTFIGAGCDPVACDSEGKTVLEAAVEHGHTLTVELLVSYDVPVPHDILIAALRRGSPHRMITYLIHLGADVHATTSNGHTALHLAVAEYVEWTCRDLVSKLIDAGCDPAVRNADEKTALEAAIERGYTSVVERLFQRHPFSSDMLPFAVERRCSLQMIALLARAAKDVAVSQPDWDALRQRAHAAYSGRYRREVMDILEVAHGRTCGVGDEDEVPVRVAKKPRLE